MAITAHSICINVSPQIRRSNTKDGTFTLEGNYVAFPEPNAERSGSYKLHKADDTWAAEKEPVATVVLVFDEHGTVSIS